MPDPEVAELPQTVMQAVVVIHGMGEQIPMDTIKDFVHAVWQKDHGITANNLPDPTEVWSKPDDRTGSLELRRITTRESVTSAPEFPTGVRTDFYELYWADLTAGATWNSLKAWVTGLLFRPLKRVPPNVRMAWLVLWLGSVIVIVLAILAVLPASAWKAIGLPVLANRQWLLARAYWGRGYASEAAGAALNHGFGELALEQIVAVTVPANRRSRRVMERLGMARDPADDFDHPNVPEGALRRHVLYRMRNPWIAL